MNYLTTNKYIIHIAALLLSYLGARTVFQQLPELKSLFIYPTGVIVNSFYATGSHINSEWVYIFNQTKFVLGESCSGTTFFSLLISYLIYSRLKNNTPLFWLALTYPITLVANTMRVLSSIYAHQFLAHINAENYSDSIHVVTGTVTFLSCLLLVALLIEKSGNTLPDAKP